MQNILWYYTMNIEQHYIDLYKVMHQDKRNYQGISLMKETPNIANIVLETNSHTVLDYGCGKGNQYIESHLNILFHIPDDNIFMYDPGFDEHKKLPDRKFDGVISTDVMEHIPEEELPESLELIFSKATKFVYLAICTSPSMATLPNGENAHCTLEDIDWWKEIVNRYRPTDILTHIRTYNQHDQSENFEVIA